MNNKLQKLLATIGLAAVFTSTSAYAIPAVITFDDIDTSSGETLIQNGYAGLNWDNFYTLPFGYYPGSGYDYGTVTMPNVGYNGFAAPAAFSSTTSFDLYSIDVTKAWYDGWTHFEGYLGSTLVYSQDIFSTTVSPVHAIFNWTGIDKVVMSDGDSTYQTAIDNVVFAVPEPETYLMLLVGLGLIGFSVRSRKQIA